MAFSTINKSSLYQNNVLYTGNAGTQSITGVGFQPDLTWIKCRGAAEIHTLVDSVRGDSGLNTGYFYLASSANSADGSGSGNTLVSALGVDGFSIGNNDRVNIAQPFVSWNWLAGGTAITGSGSLTNTRSTNTTAGFSIIKYTSTATASSTIAHGLGSTPDFVLIKRLGATANWILWATPLGATTNYLYPNNNTGTATSTDWIGVDATNITLKVTWGELNTTGDYICYAFKNIQGYSKCGSYTGNGNADGTFVYTGFKPSLLIRKKTNDVGDWRIDDNKRDGYNTVDFTLFPNESHASTQSAGYAYDLLSNGFKARGNSGNQNTSGGTYMYMAFGQPIISNSGVCATAR